MRFVYNYFLADRINAYKEKCESRSYFQQCKMLTILKSEKEWLKEPDKWALNYALRNLNTAYKNFFTIGFGFPKFKSKNNYHKSYTTTGDNNRVRIVDNFIVLPKLGKVKIVLSRNIPEGSRIINATVSQEPSGKYFVSICAEYELDIPKNELKTSNAIGLDYSNRHFYVDSDGNSADMPHFDRSAQKKLAREQRRLARKDKGGKNYEKQRIKTAKAFEKVRKSRFDWQHKESTRLINNYDFISVESIDYEESVRDVRFAKSVRENGFGQFRTFLLYKAEENGKKLIAIDKWYPSSKSCHVCGYVNHNLTLKDRNWTCPQCGTAHDRDVNAAINIKNEGLRMLCESN